MITYTIAESAQAYNEFRGYLVSSNTKFEDDVKWVYTENLCEVPSPFLRVFDNLGNVVSVVYHP